MAKTYIDGASCKAVNGQFWEFFNISFNIEKLSSYANDKGYVNLTLSKRKEVGQYGDTHYFTLNEWKPEDGGNVQTPKGNSNAPKAQKPSQSNDEEVSISDIPF